MTKALFFDIDGTLVSFETHRIPSSTIKALEATRTKGLKIFIATGRPKAIINNLSELQDRNLIDGYITMNGAYCFVGEKVIYKSAIPQKEVKAMAAFCEKKGAPCIFVEEEEKEIRSSILTCEIGRWYPAFADGGNDISMLRHAAIGVAMGQAKEDVKEAADYVTDSVNEDGISKTMKHFGII